MLKRFWQKLSNGDKLFAIFWLVLLLWGTLLFLSVVSGSFGSSKRAEMISDLNQNPMIQNQVQLLRQRGVPKSAIDSQLAQMTDGKLGLIVAQRSRAVLWGSVALVIVGAAILLLRSGSGIGKEKRAFVLGVIIAVLIIQGLYTATRYIIPDYRDLSCPDGIKKLAKLDKLYRVHAVNKAFFNPWISEYFPLYEIPTIDVPADSRPSVWRKAFFYGDDLKIAKRLLYANVRYVLGGAEELGYLKSLGVQFDPIGNFSYKGQRQTIGELKKTLPRFYAPQSAVLIPKIEDALAVMNKKETDPLAVCLLQSGEPLEKGEGTNTLTLVNFTPEKVELQTSFDFPGYAVLACEPLDGWKAEIDGAKADVVRCNLMQQAVAVPKGSHKVTFIFSKRDLSSIICDYSHIVFLPLFSILTLALFLLPKKNAE